MKQLEAEQRITVAVGLGMVPERLHIECPQTGQDRISIGWQTIHVYT